MTGDNRHNATDLALLIQLSDTHLCADITRKQRGINTRDSFDAVTRLAADHLQAARHIIVTGDISEDCSLESYQYIQQTLDHHSATNSFLPGNHDLIATMLQVVSQPSWPSSHRVGSWLLIGLNTQHAGQTAGQLDPQQLSVLDQLLQDNSKLPTLVALHHPPVSTDSSWMDGISLLNQSDLRQVLQKHNQVKAVIFGHAHQEVDKTLDNIRWLGCPSTCVQFLPGTDTGYSDTRFPGYRWLKLFDNGDLETGVERITNWPAGSQPEYLKPD